MDDAIQIDQLSKRYRLGLTQGDLRETLAEGAASLLGRRRRDPAGEFWALRDVSLRIGEGEAIGLVGRNGAGKSTLLKILARITEPTAGRSRTRGRVGALLEVGTGFHGELTGRENTFLNGAILGMPRRVVADRLDEIVGFAGVERFLDTPVKRYSSGMFLRLAFSVAAHLDSEVLVVDEVLAVGDAEFQRRCLGRMSEVEAQGRTVVFVSHDLAAVATLCERVVWLDQGRVVADGPAQAVLDAYLAAATSRPSDPQAWSRPGSGVVLERFELLADGAGALVERGEPLRLGFGFELTRPVEPFEASILIQDLRGRILIEEPLPVDPRAEPGRYEGTMEVPPLLNVGRYTASFWAGSHFEDYAYADQAVGIEVVGDDQGVRKPALRVTPGWRIEGPLRCH